MGSLKNLIIGAILAIIVISYGGCGCNRVDAGHVGLKVNMVGGDKGVSKTEYVTGWVFAEPFTQKVFEFPTYQQHKEYEAIEVPAKGGILVTVTPAFNYDVNTGEVAPMFQRFRVPLAQVEEGYMKNAMRISMREVINSFSVDSLLNNIYSFDVAVQDKLNSKLMPYFVVSQFTSSLMPDKSLRNTITAKAQAVQEALQLESQQSAIKAKAQNDIIEAKRDSTVKVIAAQADAETIKLQQQQITPNYIEYLKITKWNGVLPTVSGGSAGMMLNLDKK